MSRLSFKRRKFVANYLLLAGNGVQAVYAAGYQQGYNSACVTASRLLRNTKVEQEIEKHVLKAQLSADDVINELSEVAQIETKLDGAQKLKALELLGKYHKLFTDKVETSDTSQSDGAKQAILASIESIVDEDQISQQNAEIQLQSRFADKTRKTYRSELDPTVNAGIWPSGNMLGREQVEPEATDAVS